VEARASALPEPDEESEEIWLSGMSGGCGGWDEYPGGRRGRSWRLDRRWMQRWRAAQQPAFYFTSPAGPSGGGPFDPCAVFTTVCNPSSTPLTGSAPTAPSSRAQARQEDSRWVLENDRLQAFIDLDHLCALTVARARETTSVQFGDLPDSGDCTVSPERSERGVAVRLEWRGPTWSQQAVVSLEDDDEAPTAVIERTVTGPRQSSTTYVANLSPVPRPWPVDGREVQLAPGEIAQLPSR
jgi:hypothetical protein